MWHHWHVSFFNEETAGSYDLIPFLSLYIISALILPYSPVKWSPPLPVPLISLSVWCWDLHVPLPQCRVYVCVCTMCSPEISGGTTLLAFDKDWIAAARYIRISLCKQMFLLPAVLKPDSLPPAHSQRLALTWLNELYTLLQACRDNTTSRMHLCNVCLYF